MKRGDFFYDLPEELIAQTPVNPRDHSRLLVFNRQTEEITHRHFFDLVDFLRPGDLLVLNNSKVFPARLLGEKKGTHGKVEVFLLRELARNDKQIVWQALIGGRVRPGQEIIFKNNLIVTALLDNNDGTWQVGFSGERLEVLKRIEEIGQVPLPPYIKEGKAEESDKLRYQTVFAHSEKQGSAAAPTAGLHFTAELLEKIQDKGIEILEVTLHVGLGTFSSVKTELIEEHKMHAEWFEIEPKVWQSIVQAKKEGRRVITVGTTATRTVESAAEQLRVDDWAKCEMVKKTISGWTDIFIYPGKKFRVVDSLVTNFHLPESTLLMLVSAFLEQGSKLKGVETMQGIYQIAIKDKYRFFSYGDAMLIE